MEEKRGESREEEVLENMDGVTEGEVSCYKQHSANKAVLSEAAAHMTNSQQLCDLQIDFKSAPTARLAIVYSTRLWASTPQTVSHTKPRYQHRHRPPPCEPARQPEDKLSAMEQPGTSVS